MRVRLMLTCLCDAFYGEVGIATVRVLEHAGCEVEFVEAQTCCGQPPFNAGDWPAARSVATRCSNLLEGEMTVVTPSSSCAAMLRHGYPMLGVSVPKVFELSEFLLDELGLKKWPLDGNRVTRRRTVAFHRACHGRMLHLGDRQERLLTLVRGISLAPFEQGDQCCGFGRGLSVGHPTISTGIGLEKLRSILESGVDTIVSGDMGCLMQLQGLIDRERLPLKTLHYLQILAEELD